ncbi:cyclodeaminase/cyclohydrolase family protein [Nonomuraea sp. NPDC048916]|uniref:cyclodeaminase/cyclohydrolase family protein n=1 Tax=Nonomuraea sp. NPDC048916 TaxID=3154232 RepID=UPI0033F631A7
MRDTKIGDFLTLLADRVPAPGGGATSALHAAQAAALLGMVARYSTGDRYAEFSETIAAVMAETDTLRERALLLAEEDAAAFTAVTDAYRLPEGDERGAAISAALAGAAEPPARVAETAGRLVSLCETLLPIGNRDLLADVAAAAEAARAALTTARVNVEVNMAGIKDAQVLSSLHDRLAVVDVAIGRAEGVTAEVREELAR